MDYMILWSTAKLMHYDLNKIRLVVGSFIGAVFSIIILFPELYFLNYIIVKIIFSILIVLATFFPFKLKKLFSILIYFYFMNFAVGGIVIGLIFLFNSNNLMNKNKLLLKIFYFNFKYLFWAVIFILVLSLLYRNVFKNHFNNMVNVPVTICINNKIITTKALLDTGNNLKDPMSGMPVIVTDFNVIKDVLPLSFQKMCTGNYEITLNELSKITDTALYKRLRIIPFNSVGKTSGMMIGIIPDEIIVNQREPVKLKKVIVGLSNKNLFSKGDYGILLHPDLLYNTM
jgi:stage II sporulation protein GA (sporulation sigma-E factor processing peptidase)